MEVFTGLDREPIVNVVLKPRAKAGAYEVVQGELQQHETQLDALRSSLNELHAEIVETKERRRLQQQAAKKGRECTFSVGDFVLWSRSDPRMSGGKLMVRWHYADRMLEVTEELKHHVALQEINLGVHAVLDAKYHRRANKWQLLVSWQGLEDSENSWEAFDGIYAAVPDKVAQYADNCADNGFKKFLKSLQDNIGV
ncbi:hypothetical protein PF010_g32564 [Phytophthora fragariae]|uniref:Chromo domain-containing protein n=1 Tax=Phytophthora fragariae TaxID=53985 RepID=A0A6A3PNM7_9STRA|nr:hypothetical protein PF010_g32564 [Phytophthora fragariae]KAE9055041.1 hypothetical protein PF007_g32440 [Phytophthora fragariae]